jgi:hypothetical protein
MDVNTHFPTDYTLPQKTDKYSLHKSATKRKQQIIVLISFTVTRVK